MLVIGPNPDERVQAFSKQVGTDPFIVYKKSEAVQIRQDYMDEYGKFIADIEAAIQEEKDEKTLKMLENQRDLAKVSLYDLSQQSPEDFFEDLQYGKDLDEEGNIITYYNKNGKFSRIQRAGRFANPFVLKNGQEKYQTIAGDVDWEKIHCAAPAVNTYTRLWEMCVEGSEPQNETERGFYENMKNRQEYFDYFDGKDNSVASNTALWFYAVVDENNEYHDPTADDIGQFEWMTTFFDKFLKNLPEDKMLTIYECSR